MDAVANTQVLYVGDFSFALSLSRCYKLASITATCFDSNEALLQKYPDVGATIDELKINVSSSDDVDGPTETHRAVASGDEWEGFSDSGSLAQHAGDNDLTDAQKATTRSSVYFGVDATKLSSAHKKLLRPHTPFTKIVFNFPHVGGLSTDVNRQVRSNQQLLVGFFNAAKPLLASASNPVRHDNKTNDEAYGTDDSVDEDLDHTDPPNGQILVTIFEGEPYTLWNIRDLARHCGLKVVESFRFPWEAYPGYRHARTVGDITTGKDRGAEGKRKGAWRGEERDARCYVLGVKEDDDDSSSKAAEVNSAATGSNGVAVGTPKQKKRRERKWDSDESD